MDVGSNLQKQDSRTFLKCRWPNLQPMLQYEQVYFNHLVALANSSVLLYQIKTYSFISVKQPIISREYHKPYLIVIMSPRSP